MDFSFSNALGLLSSSCSASSILALFQRFVYPLLSASARKGEGDGQARPGSGRGVMRIVLLREPRAASGRRLPAGRHAIGTFG